MALLMLAAASPKNPRVKYMHLDLINPGYKKIDSSNGFFCFFWLRSRTEIHKGARRFAKRNLPAPARLLDGKISWWNLTRQKKYNFRLLGFHFCRSGRNIFQHCVNDLRGRIALYTAGFPCTPFSCLHSGSAMLGDANSRQMWQCLNNIKVMRPAATSLHFRCFTVVIICRGSPRLKWFVPWSLETISCNWDLLAWKCAGICPCYRSGAGPHIGKSSRESHLEWWLPLMFFLPCFWNNNHVKHM